MEAARLHFYTGEERLKYAVDLVLLLGEKNLVIVTKRIEEVEGILLVANRKRLMLDDVEIEIAERLKRPNRRLSTDYLGRLSQNVGLVVMPYGLRLADLDAVIRVCL